MFYGERNLVWGYESGGLIQSKGVIMVEVGGVFVICVFESMFKDLVGCKYGSLQIVFKVYLGELQFLVI